MSRAAQNHKLRLVGIETEQSEAWAAPEAARLAVVKENRLAAAANGLDPADPRWLLASQTQARLQGATLPPESRETLIRNGVRMGLRPFEANLVIALVQDRARTDRPLSRTEPLLRLVRPPAGQPAATTRVERPVWPLWFAAISAAIAVAALLVRWFAGG